MLASEPSRTLPTSSITSEASMKIQSKRLVVILGTSDFSSSIAERLNQSQSALGEPEIIAALVAQSNGSLSQAEIFLTAHPETRIVVLQGRAFKEHLREAVKYFLHRKLQVVVIVFPSDDQPLKKMERQYQPLGVSVIGENRANFMSLLESTILHLLNPSTSTRRKESVHRRYEDERDEETPRRLHRSASPNEIPVVQSYANLLGISDDDLDSAPSENFDEENPEPEESSLPLVSHTVQRQVRVSWPTIPRLPGRVSSEQRGSLRQASTEPMPATSKTESPSSDPEDIRTLTRRIEHLESEQAEFLRRLEELEREFTQEQRAVRLALEQAGDALLFAVSALRHIPMPARSTGTTTPPPEPAAPQLEKSSALPSEGSPTVSAHPLPSSEPPPETPASHAGDEEKGQRSCDSVLSPRQRELLEFLRSHNKHIVPYGEIEKRFVNRGNITMLVSTIRARARSSSLPNPIETHPGIGLSAQ